MAPARDSPDEDFDFNDMTRRPSSEEARRSDQAEEIPKPKRIACILCRKRKLKCDSKRPACSTCVRLQHDCSYDEVRKKSGPKRGYVKALEARLLQVETLLNSKDDDPPPAFGRQDSHEAAPYADILTGGADCIDKDSGFTLVDDFANMNTEDPLAWEIIGLGLNEPLPVQEVVDELNKEYFNKVHPSMPMIHKARYHAAMNLAPPNRPPVALRYAMWALAAAVCDKYVTMQEHFYTRARKYLHQDEMRGHGEAMITIAHAQAWVLIATYEFKMMYFPRAWMSAGRGSRMCMMMGLHRVDSQGLDVKQCLLPSRDDTEREERRRTFWMAFCVDRYSSIGTGWPMVMDEKDIGTQLPCDDDAFEYNRPPAKSIRLHEVLDLNSVGFSHLSPFAGCVLLAALFGRNLTHLHRPSPEDRDDDLLGEFWKRHRHMDDILSATALGLPSSLRLPSGLNNPNVIFLNMSIHTSTICLHQAAIFKADKNNMPNRISAESKIRCITAAAEISSIMRTISHLDLSTMNPFISFCLYVAARVFVQYLKSRPKDVQVKTSLHFLLHAMTVIKKKNPLTESFLVQLDVDLEGAGLEDSRKFRDSSEKTEFDHRFADCLIGQQPDEHSRRTTGDGGLGTYTNPDTAAIREVSPLQGVSSPSSLNAEVLQAVDFSEFSNLHSIEVDDVLGRQPPSRSRGSYASASQHDMDTSPDGTPGSSVQQVSTDSSHTGYSPPQAQDPSMMRPAYIHPTTSTFSSDLNTTTLPNAQNDSSLLDINLLANWGGNSMTPAVSTGFTPAPEPISEAEFNEFMNQGNFTNWDTEFLGVTHSEPLDAFLATRASRR